MRHAVNPVRRLVILTAVALAVGGGRAEAETILTPVDAHGIRQLPGVQPILPNFLAINHSIEDRTVLQFDVGGLSAAARAVDLGLSTCWTSTPAALRGSSTCTPSSGPGRSRRISSTPGRS